MVMIKVSSSERFSGMLAIIVGTVGISALALLSLSAPVYAGPQSLLNPYANIQPSASQPDAKPLGNRASPKKPRSSGRLKSAKAPQKSAPGQSSTTANSAAANPGFLSGVKEIQHGYVTTFKAAGHGIINGSKSAGATIAAGGGKVKDGLSAAGHKIIPGPKILVAKTPDTKNPATKNREKNKAHLMAKANSSTVRATSALDTTVSELPGKPLGPVVSTFARPAKVKPPTVGKKNKNIVAHTFDKFNIFAKHKKKNADLAANNQNAVAR